MKVFYYCCFLALVSVGCVHHSIDDFFLGYKTWGLNTQDHAKILYPKELNVSQTELHELMTSKWNSLEGISWGTTSLATKQSITAGSKIPFSEGIPHAKEFLQNSKYTERWTYPYAYVYFKGDHVTDVQFREDEIAKLKGPVKYGMSRMLK